jgi:hypothetical protein
MSYRLCKCLKFHNLRVITGIWILAVWLQSSYSQVQGHIVATIMFSKNDTHMPTISQILLFPPRGHPLPHSLHSKRLTLLPGSWSAAFEISCLTNIFDNLIVWLGGRGGWELLAFQRLKTKIIKTDTQPCVHEQVVQSKYHILIKTLAIKAWLKLP